MNHEKGETAQDQLRAEIHAAIKRLGMESDLTFYQALGVLRIVEHDLVEILTKSTTESP